jgi:uncharacterized protein YjiS (DUF1127 family)
METTTNVFAPRQTVGTVRLGLAVLARGLDALLEWREREKLRARLNNLSDWELLDIGIGRGEVDYVVSHRACDPRSAVLPP